MPNHPVSDLTPRRMEILALVAKGLTNKDICELLGISPNTVKVHVAAIISALDVANRTEAAALYERALTEPAQPPEVRVAARIGRPAIAVVPLKQLGRADDYLAEALTQDLITRLSAWRWFPVIAHASSRLYDKDALELAKIRDELGVSYVITGSVRHDNETARINVHLFETGSGANLWSDFYDLELTASLDMQDEITRRVVSHIAPELLEEEARRPAAERFDAWRSTMSGMWHLGQRTAASVAQALTHFDDAVSKDPQMVQPWFGKVWAHHHRIVEQWTTDPVATMGMLRDAVTRCEALDPRGASTQMVLGLREMLVGDAQKAIHHLERAANLNPSSTQALGLLGQCYCLSNESDQAIAAVEEALRLNPFNPNTWAQKSVIALAHFAAGRHEEALAMAGQAVLDKADTITGHLVLVAASVETGATGQARQFRENLAALRPTFQIDDYLKLIAPTADPMHIERIKAAFASTAGLRSQS